MSATITLADPPSVADVAAEGLAAMAMQTGVPSDSNVGSQIRTIFEAVGGVAEMQGVMAQALAFQALVYSAYAAFGITPLAAVAATGNVTFSAANGTASQNVIIQAGTQVGTGSQSYVTTQDVVLASGSGSVTAPVQALSPGSGGNTAAGTITSLSSGLAYPVLVTNPSALSNGTDAESAAATLGRFTAAVLAAGRGSPVSIANACVGIGVPGTAEAVQFATVYEAWIGQPAGSQTASFAVYVDNGSGAASAALLAAVKARLDGNAAAGDIGERPAGVPYSVNAASPVGCSVVVTASLMAGASAAALGAAVAAALKAYFATVGFAQTVQIAQVTAVVGSVLAGYVTSLTVALYDASNTQQTQISATYAQRVVLDSTTTNLS